MNLSRLYNVLTFNNSAEAIKHIRQYRPDLVIADLMMNTYDEGFINARKIKSIYPDLPVILLTAVGSETGISFTDISPMAAEQLIVNEVIDKGCSAQTLIKSIEKYL